MAIIRFEGVSHAYGRTPVLSNIDLELSERRVAIIGANGSGKSTLARMINGLVTPSSGRVTVDGLDSARKGAAVRRRVGFVFTDPDNQIVMPTVAEDLAFSLRRSRLNKAEIADRVHEMLQKFGLGEYGDHPSHLLSGGQKQMLAIGAVLIRDPDVVVADEPTTLLDLRNARMIASALGGIDRQVITVTHHLPMIADYDRAVVIDCGAVAFDGSPVDAVAAYERLLG